MAKRKKYLKFLIIYFKSICYKISTRSSVHIFTKTARTWKQVQVTQQKINLFGRSSQEMLFCNQGSENWGEEKTFQIAELSKCSFVRNNNSISIQIKEDFREMKSAKISDTRTEQTSSGKRRSRRIIAEISDLVSVSSDSSEEANKEPSRN